MKNNFLTENYNRLYSSILIDLLIDKDITDYYISPGMRNVPLISAIINRKQEVKVYSGIDERAMAYRALGNSKVSNIPSVLICTSGTAVANYLPAVIEANKSNIPLIIISADRPFELTRSGANQCIDQNNIFNDYIIDKVNMDINNTAKIKPKAFSNILNHIISKSIKPSFGVIHINLGFSEPLDNTIEDISLQCINELETLTHYKNFSKNDKCPNSFLNFIKKKFEEDNGLIVLGNLPYIKDKTDYFSLIDIIKKSGHLIYADITSSLKHNTSLKNGLVPSLDHPEVLHILKSKKLKFILHLGAAVTSKFYYKFLENHPEIELITVNDRDTLQDPSLTQDIHLNMKPDLFAKEFTKQNIYLGMNSVSNGIISNYESLIEKKSKLIDQAPLTYPAITKYVMENIKSDSHLFISNSTLIRSFDNYSRIENNNNKTIHIHSNRGASGIEGLIATTIGISDKISLPIDLFIGDISFLYDLNSLQMLKNIKNHINIFICNNASGGIFTLLPIAKDKDVLPYITTPHELSFEHAAKLFDISYKKIQDLSELKNHYPKRNLQAELVKIYEIEINNDDNTELYNFLKTVKL